MLQSFYSTRERLSLPSDRRLCHRHPSWVTLRTGGNLCLTQCIEFDEFSAKAFDPFRVSNVEKFVIGCESLRVTRKNVRPKYLLERFQVLCFRFRFQQGLSNILCGKVCINKRECEIAHEGNDLSFEDSKSAYAPYDHLPLTG